MGTRRFETFGNDIDGEGAVVSYSAQFRLELECLWTGLRKRVARSRQMVGLELRTRW
jgi:hypothetical protein